MRGLCIRVGCVCVCVRQATLAYLSGNKALARELSRRGKEYANRMWSAHERAVEDLMHTRQAIRHVPGGKRRYKASMHAAKYVRCS